MMMSSSVRYAENGAACTAVVIAKDVTIATVNTVMPVVVAVPSVVSGVAASVAQRVTVAKRQFAMGVAVCVVVAKTTIVRHA